MEDPRHKHIFGDSIMKGNGIRRAVFRSMPENSPKNSCKSEKATSPRKEGARCESASSPAPYSMARAKDRSVFSWLSAWGSPWANQGFGGFGEALGLLAVLLIQHMAIRFVHIRIHMQDPVGNHIRSAGNIKDKPRRIDTDAEQAFFLSLHLHQYISIFSNTPGGYLGRGDFFRKAIGEQGSAGRVLQGKIKNASK